MDGLAPRNDLNVGELVPTALKSALCASLAFFLLCMAVIPNAHAQSLAGHSVGENQSLLEAQNTRRLTEDLGEYTTAKSSPSVGVELSGRYRKSTGTVVYLELVGDGSRPASADFGGFRFGKTTLENIRSELKSAGILFNKSPPVYPTPDGGVMIASTYEVANTSLIASFITKISVGSLAKLKLKYGTEAYAQAALLAKLEKVIVAEADYFKTLHGSEIVFDVGYRPFTWQNPAYTTAASPAREISLARIKPSQLPVYRIYSGPNNAPDFSSTDASVRSFRTRISSAIEGGPTFAGEFAVVEIGCGTACSIAFAANVRTGEVFRLPLGGEENQYLDLMYQLDSRLLVAQWAEIDPSKCHVEFLSFDDGEWISLLKHDVGSSDRCNQTIAENLNQ